MGFPPRNHFCIVSKISLGKTDFYTIAQAQRRSYVTGSSQGAMSGLQNPAVWRAVGYRGSTCTQVCALVPEDEASLSNHSAEPESLEEPWLPVVQCAHMLPSARRMDYISNCFSKAANALDEVWHKTSPTPFPWALAVLLQHKENWSTSHSSQIPNHSICIVFLYAC